MLCLSDQVNCDDLGISSLVCNDENFRWSGKKIDSNSSKKHSLCFSHILISGANQNVCPASGKKAECHCGNSLNPTHGKDVVCTA